MNCSLILENSSLRSSKQCSIAVHGVFDPSVDIITNILFSRGCGIRYPEKTTCLSSCSCIRHKFPIVWSSLLIVNVPRCVAWLDQWRKVKDLPGISPASWTLSSFLYATLSPCNINREYRSGWFISTMELRETVTLVSPMLIASMFRTPMVTRTPWWLQTLVYWGTQ